MTTLADLLRAKRSPPPPLPPVVLSRPGGGLLTITAETGGVVAIRVKRPRGARGTLLTIKPEEVMPVTEALLRARGVPLDLPLGAV